MKEITKRAPQVVGYEGTLLELWYEQEDMEGITVYEERFQPLAKDGEAPLKDIEFFYEGQPIDFKKIKFRWVKK
jgi:hypothetical protein